MSFKSIILQLCPVLVYGHWGHLISGSLLVTWPRGQRGTPFLVYFSPPSSNLLGVLQCLSIMKVLRLKHECVNIHTGHAWGISGHPFILAQCRSQLCSFTSKGPSKTKYVIRTLFYVHEQPALIAHRFQSLLLPVGRSFTFKKSSPCHL